MAGRLRPAYRLAKVISEVPMRDDDVSAILYICPAGSRGLNPHPAMTSFRVMSGVMMEYILVFITSSSSSL